MLWQVAICKFALHLWSRSLLSCCFDSRITRFALAWLLRALAECSSHSLAASRREFYGAGKESSEGCGMNRMAAEEGASSPSSQVYSRSCCPSLYRRSIANQDEE
ncbi:uncharacterized protein BJ171DRAFT_38596 [Polychytrium aggregatum]|uniref:uncharacterized protein n=1 Tax=Polychytrium aggregatum TaxID=110093 RepID=UPI0022FDB110|nr:uncharacterized protein BJ171DRAFT_38596 [Polychytrium aggregatum]KAI9190838.1 hypothetical protein BJ171DRAFT_38596 [Polychytrium aggregatum]